MANPLVERWQNASVQDPLYRRDLNHLIRKDLSVRFQEPLVFGTAGMRGLMGFGPDRINELTIAAASQAYAQYLRSLSPKVLKQGVIIGHDNRANSDFFAKVTYDVLRAHQIKAFLFEANELQPSPLVSYTVRKLSLAGGIVITASHNPKQYNGFKVYDHLGGQLTGEAAKTVQTNMVKIDPLGVKRKAGSYSYVSQDIVESYVQALLQLRQRPDDSKVLKVVFSPLHGTGGKVGNELLKRMNIDHLNVSKQMEPDPEFSSLKSPNPEDGHAFARSVSLARTKKADLVVVTDPDADRLGVVVKYKHRFKYLNGNQVAALYLDYLINQLKLSGQLPKRGYIIKTTVSGQLPAQIARRAGLKVYETHVGFKNIAEKIESLSQTNQQFVFAYEESYGFLLNPSVSRDKDALQALVGVVEMANYYKTQGTNLYERLLELFKMHGIHRSIVMSKVLTPSAQAKLFTRIKKVRKIAGLKVVESVDYNIGRHSLPNQNMLKITLSNGTWFAIRPSGTEPKVKIYIQTIGTTEQELVDIVTTEKTISNLIEDNIESPIATKIKASSVIRYGLFIAVIAALLAIVFLYVYKGARNRTVFDVAHLVFSSQMRIVWFGLVVWMTFTLVLEAWVRKRMLALQNEKVKFHHLIIASFMGLMITFVTPFSIGGDAIGYWYLRRKGVRRGPLLSAIISSLVIYQAGIVLQTAALLPIGYPIYRDFLSTNQTGSRATLIWFLVGLSWNLFATIMIFLLSLHVRFQHWIVDKTISFLEWLPFVRIYDPGIWAARVQFEFAEMRQGMRSLWAKWWIIFEIIFYTFLPVFFQPHALVLALGGFVRTDLSRGTYWSQIVTFDIIKTANSLSITPGGSGTGEWLNITVNKYLYQDSQFLHENNLTPESLASGIDLNWKLLWVWPSLIMSALLVFNITVGERRVRRYSLINKNLRLAGKKLGRSTRVYYYTALPWILILTIWILLIFFYPN